MLYTELEKNKIYTIVINDIGSWNTTYIFKTNDDDNYCMPESYSCGINNYERYDTCEIYNNFKYKPYHNYNIANSAIIDYFENKLKIHRQTIETNKNNKIICRKKLEEEQKIRQDKRNNRLKHLKKFLTINKTMKTILKCIACGVAIVLAFKIGLILIDYLPKVIESLLNNINNLNYK